VKKKKSSRTTKNT